MIAMLIFSARRILFGWSLVAALACSFAAFGQAYPSKPVRLMVPAAAGGVADIAARALVQPLGQALGQPVVAENRVGANGNIGAEACAKASADGYTACFLQGVLVAINPLAYSSVPFDMERDFAPVIHLNWYESGIFVTAALPVKNIKELLDLGRAKPGSLNWGSIGLGSSSHLYLEWFQAKSGAVFNHVPYKGNPQLLLAAAGGEVQAMLNTPGASLAQLKAGKIRALAVIRKRSPLLPDVPTLQEQGYDLDFRNWNAVFFQRGAPGEAVRRWNAELNRIVRDPKFEQRYLAPVSLSASGGTPEELAEITRSSRITAAELVRISKLKLD